MKLFLILSLFLFGCTSGCDGKNTGDSSVQSPIHWEECGYEVGDHACDLTLADQNGKSWNLYDNYGKVIIVDFSTEWCGYCHRAAEKTQEVQNENQHRGFEYVTILVEDMAGNSPPLSESVERWCSHYNIEAPVLIGDRSLTTEDAWNVSSWPTFYVLNKDLVIIEIIRGYNEQVLSISIENAYASTEEE